MDDTTCGCGRPGRYTTGMHTDSPTYSCNKYKRCPSYQELEYQLQKKNTDFAVLLKAAEDVMMYRDGSSPYESACAIIDKFTVQDSFPSDIETIAAQAITALKNATVEELETVIRQLGYTPHPRKDSDG